MWHSRLRIQCGHAVQFLAQKLPHAMVAAKKKRMQKMNLKVLEDNMGENIDALGMKMTF